MPGLRALNKGYRAWVMVSCAPAGNCAAGGGYFYVNTGQHEFVAISGNLRSPN